MRFLNNVYSNRSKGFTLVESMVAISILSLAVTAPLLIAQKGIGSAVYSRDQITAFYLAQEAIEYVRNVRDTNRITGQWWLAQFAPASCQPFDYSVHGSNPTCTTINGNYEIDAKFTDAIYPCSGGVCRPLKYDSANNNNLYTYSAGTNTHFTRTVHVNNTANGKEALISVTISWTTNLFEAPRTFSVKEYLFNF